MIFGDPLHLSSCIGGSLLLKKVILVSTFTWYSISLGVACSPVATGSGVTATVGEAGSVCCCEGGGAGLAGSSSL